MEQNSMSVQLINHSEDLQKLINEDYVVEIRDNVLLIHRIPYLNADKEILYGTLVSKIQISGYSTIINPEHTVYFAGEMPCRLNGSPFTSLVNNSNPIEIAGVKVNHFMSSKPKPNGYRDYYHKMTTYINLISAPAKAIDDSASEKGRQIINNECDSPFVYADTNSNKPELSSLNSKFKGQKIAIIGLGGTGSYILDLVAKVPVDNIHIYDSDWYYNNNAFRSPGAADICDLVIPKRKVDYYKSMYSKIHKGIVVHPKISQGNIQELANYNFAFISIDKGAIKKSIIEVLQSHEIAFIDVGMGVYNVDGSLTGLIRTTTGTQEKTDHIWKKGVISFTEDKENEYDSNIQIAELNSINASLAVIKWKKLLGYYHDMTSEHNMFYRINSNKIFNNETGA